MRGMLTQAAHQVTRASNEARKEFLAKPDNKEAILFLESQTGDNPFFNDLRQQFASRGHLTEKQVQAVLKNKRGGYKPQKREKIQEGKQEITGEILLARVQDSQEFGPRLKVLIKDDRGFNVFGTCPQAVRNSLPALVANDDGVPEVKRPGIRVTMTADVSPKEDYFGYYKYPQKASVVTDEKTEDKTEDKKEEKPEERTLEAAAKDEQWLEEVGLTPAD
jgi:hypothetical protein